MSAARYLCTTSELEATVGARPPGAGLKSIAHLDAHCATFLAASTFAVLGAFGASGTPRTVALGGAPGHASVAGPHAVALPHLCDAAGYDGAPAGLLAFLPGYRETLRVNGTVRIEGGARLEVEEAFLHCAKAMIRSRFWDDVEIAAVPAVESEGTPMPGFDLAARAFVARAPFVAISSVDGNGRADVSPKGDPPGFLRVLDDHTLAIPDRPGNRRTDTMHNLLERSEVGLVVLVPGDERLVEVRGRARVTDDRAVCEPMAVQGKVPAAALVVEVDSVELRHDRAIADAALWDTTRHVPLDALPRASRIWVDHVRLNADPGLGAKAMRAVVNEPALAASLRRDYRKNLY